MRRAGSARLLVRRPQRQFPLQRRRRAVARRQRVLHRRQARLPRGALVARLLLQRKDLRSRPAIEQER